MNKLINYFQQSWNELFKVVWPTRAQAIRLTVVVLVFSGIAALYITIFDEIFKSALQHLVLKG